MASVLGHNMHCVVLFAQHRDVTKVKASKEQKNLQEYHQKALLLVSQHNYRFRGPLWCINHGQQQKREEVVCKLWTLYLLFQLNHTFPPSREKGFRAISRGAYCLTLSVCALDNLCKFLVATSQVAFKFYTVEHGIAKPVTIVDLMLMIINASLYLSFLQFFWQKLFRGDKDILTVFKQEFRLTENIRVPRRRRSFWQIIPCGKNYILYCLVLLLT